MSKQYEALRREGYQHTGIVLDTWKDRAIIEEKAKALKVMGNKVKIVTKTDVTHFRDAVSKSSYWVVMVLYSEEWKKDQAAKREAIQKEARKKEIIKIAEGLSLEEALDIVYLVKVRGETK